MTTDAPEFELPEGSLIELGQEVVAAPHPDAQRGLPDPEVAPVFDRLTPHYEVAVFGRHPAARLRGLVVNGDVACVGHHGLEVLRGRETEIAYADEERMAALRAFVLQIKADHGRALARLGATLKEWDHALSLDWRLAGDRRRVELIATVIRREATRPRVGLVAVETPFALDVLPVEADEETAIKLLVSHGSPYGTAPPLMRVTELGRSPGTSRVVTGRLVTRGIVPRALDIQVAGEFTPSTAPASSVVIHGVAGPVEVVQPLGDRYEMVEMLRSLVPPR